LDGFSKHAQFVPSRMHLSTSARGGPGNRIAWNRVSAAIPMSESSKLRFFDDARGRCVARTPLRQFHNDIAASATGAGRGHPAPEKFEVMTPLPKRAPCQSRRSLVKKPRRRTHCDGVSSRRSYFATVLSAPAEAWAALAASGKNSTKLQSNGANREASIHRSCSVEIQ
jgi:hypothetical protein